MRSRPRTCSADVSASPRGSLATGRVSLFDLAMMPGMLQEFARLIADRRGQAKCYPPAASAPSEPVAVAHTQRIEAVVLGGSVGVGDVLVVDRDAVVLVVAVAVFEAVVEQPALAQLLAAAVGGEGLAVVDGDAETDAEEGRVGKVALPAQRGVGLAGVALEVDGGADNRVERAAPERDHRSEQDLEVEVDAVGLAVETAPHVGHVMDLRTHAQLANEAPLARPFDRGVPSRRRTGQQRANGGDCSRSHHASRPCSSLALIIVLDNRSDRARRVPGVSPAHPAGVFRIPRCQNAMTRGSRHAFISLAWRSVGATSSAVSERRGKWLRACKNLEQPEPGA